MRKVAKDPLLSAMKQLCQQQFGAYEMFSYLKSGRVGCAFEGNRLLTKRAQNNVMIYLCKGLTTALGQIVSAHEVSLD